MDIFFGEWIGRESFWVFFCAGYGIGIFGFLSCVVENRMSVYYGSLLAKLAAVLVEETVACAEWCGDLSFWVYRVEFVGVGLCGVRM